MEIGINLKKAQILSTALGSRKYVLSMAIGKQVDQLAAKILEYYPFVWFILFSILTFTGFIMKTPKTTAEQPVSTTKKAAPVSAKDSKPATKKTGSGPAVEKKVEAKVDAVAAETKVELPNEPVVCETTHEQPSAEPLAPQTAQVLEPQSVAAMPELTIFERIGLTAGGIWHYLSENGATSVAKLIAALEEEEKIVQRSIGWLAQEGKITVATVDRVETVALKN